MFKRTVLPVTIRLAAALAAAVALPAAIAPAPALAASPADDLSLVQKSLSATNSMTASFSQTDRAGKVLTGTLTIKKPGKIRFQYQKDVPLLIVGDGKNVYFIDYSVAQVQRWPVGGSPLSILIDPSKNVSRYAHVVGGGDPRIVSVEVADPKHPEYGRITLVFARDASAPGGLLLQGWVALDAQNNRTQVRLSGQKFNGAVSDNTFRWNDPRRKTHGR
jgi:outer membrane lipoprotein-sorting protein